VTATARLARPSTQAMRMSRTPRLRGPARSAGGASRVGADPDVGRLVLHDLVAPGLPRDPVMEHHGADRLAGGLDCQARYGVGDPRDRLGRQPGSRGPLIGSLPTAGPRVRGRAGGGVVRSRRRAAGCGRGR
jgi:hypothetical protein